MGLNIYLRTLEGRDHPKWDDGRYAGDRSIFDVVRGLDLEEKVLDEGWGGANNWHWRPRDFAAFRAADWPKKNTDRWAQMADILESDPDYWVYVSV